MDGKIVYYKSNVFLGGSLEDREPIQLQSRPSRRLGLTVLLGTDGRPIRGCDRVGLTARLGLEGAWERWLHFGADGAVRPGAKGALSITDRGEPRPGSEGAVSITDRGELGRLGGMMVREGELGRKTSGVALVFGSKRRDEI